MKHPKRIGFDMDGVLCENPLGFNITTSTDDEIYSMYANAIPIYQNLQVMNRINRMPGVYVYIYTARDERWRSVTESWLRRHNAQYDALVMNKLWLTYYVGDEAFNVDRLNDLEKLVRKK